MTPEREAELRTPDYHGYLRSDAGVEECLNTIAFFRSCWDKAEVERHRLCDKFTRLQRRFSDLVVREGFAHWERKALRRDKRRLEDLIIQALDADCDTNVPWDEMERLVAKRRAETRLPEHWNANADPTASDPKLPEL